MPTPIGKQAVVVGAGMAGLVAARPLADFFERGIVLETDALPKEAAHRPGTPQSRHLHGLLAGGLQALSRLFPGFEESLSQAGAVRLRMSYDYHIERPGYDPFPQRDLGLAVYSMTRPLLEFTVRKRLGEFRSIDLHKSCREKEFILFQSCLRPRHERRRVRGRHSPRTVNGAQHGEQRTGELD